MIRNSRVDSKENRRPHKIGRWIDEHLAENGWRNPRGRTRTWNSQRRRALEHRRIDRDPHKADDFRDRNVGILPVVGINWRPLDTKREKYPRKKSPRPAPPPMAAIGRGSAHVVEYGIVEEKEIEDCLGTPEDESE